MTTGFPCFRLDGMSAIVTGAGGSLGRAAALALAEAGADIVAAGLDRPQLEETARLAAAIGRKAIVFEFDVTDEGGAAQLAQYAIESFGRIDVLLNNAGIPMSQSLLDSSVAGLRRVLDVNIAGTFLCTRAVVPQMISQRSGRIINMASILARIGALNRSGYSASKAAVSHITKSLALELGPHGITVNAIGPSAIVTDLNRELMRTQPQVYAGMLERTPLGRLAQPEDLTGALVFLASSASAFMTGQTLYIDGGMTCG